MREIYTNHLMKLKDRTNISFLLLEEKTGISDSTLSRWFAGKGNPTVDDLELVFEAMGSNMEQVFRDIGEQELKASEKIDFRGTDALLEEFSRRESIYKENCDRNVAHQIELREKLQESFDTMITTMSKEHDAALRKRDETYDRSVNYLKAQIDTLEKKNAALMERTKTAEARADVAEQRQQDSDKRRHQTFFGMLALCFAMLVVGIAIYPPWG